jgi:hypothetical protein
MTAEIDDALALCQTDGRVCPQAKHWNELWKLLPGKKQIDGGWTPALPLILAAWWHSSDEEKRQRFLEHIRWAADHDALPTVVRLIKALPIDGWHREAKR